MRHLSGEDIRDLFETQTILSAEVELVRERIIVTIRPRNSSRTFVLCGRNITGMEL